MSNKFWTIVGTILIFPATIAYSEADQEQILVPETVIQAAPPKANDEPLQLDDEFSLPQGASKELVAEKAKLTTAQNNFQKVQESLGVSIRNVQFEGGAAKELANLNKSIADYDQALDNVEQAELSYVDKKSSFLDSREEKFAGNN